MATVFALPKIGPTDSGNAATGGTTPCGKPCAASPTLNARLDARPWPRRCSGAALLDETPATNQNRTMHRPLFIALLVGAMSLPEGGYNALCILPIALAYMLVARYARPPWRYQA